MTSSPQRIRAERATVEVLRVIDRSWGLLTADDLHSLVDPVKELDPRQLLSVEYNGSVRYPRFQFASSGDLSPVTTRLRRSADLHGWSDFDLIVWFATPQSRLDGAVPADLISNPEEQDGLVWAAELEMQVEW